MWQYNYSTELYHHGIKGQKWGVRRYQNSDGSLTAKGRSRYGDSKEAQRYVGAKIAKKDKWAAYDRSYSKAYIHAVTHPVSQFASKKQKAKSRELWGDATNKANQAYRANKKYKEAKKEYKQTEDYAERSAARKAKAKKIALGVGIAAVAAGGAYAASVHVGKNYATSVKMNVGAKSPTSMQYAKAGAQHIKNSAVTGARSAKTGAMVGIDNARGSVKQRAESRASNKLDPRDKFVRGQARRKDRESQEGWEIYNAMADRRREIGSGGKRMTDSQIIMDQKNWNRRQRGQGARSGK